MTLNGIWLTVAFVIHTVGEKEKMDLSVYVVIKMGDREPTKQSIMEEGNCSTPNEEQDRAPRKMQVRDQWLKEMEESQGEQ